MKRRNKPILWLVLAAGTALSACADVSKFTAQVLPAPVVRVAAASDVGMDAGGASGSAFGAYLAGLHAGRAQDLTSATDFMLQALASDPRNEQLLERAFVLAAANGRRATTVDLAQRLRQKIPDQGLAGLVMAVDAMARGAPEEANEFLAALPEKGLNTVAVPLLRSWVEVARGNLDAAQERTAPLRGREGFAVFYELHTALINDVADIKPAAKSAYDEVLEKSEAVTLRLALVAGNFFERTGEIERATELYRRMLERNSDTTHFEQSLARIEAGTVPEPSLASPADGMAETLFNLASLLSQERAEELALAHSHMALWLRPDLEIANVLIGEVLQSQKRGTEAIAVYRRIPSESPFYWTARLRIAEELERLDLVEEAVTELEGLAGTRPARFEPLYRLGNLLRGKERFAEAVVAYDRASARLGEPERRHWSLYYFRGISLERISEWPRAEQDFLRALELEPDQPFVLNYLAYSWVEKKQNLDKAKAMLARAVELRPDDGYIVDSLGWVHYRLGEFAEGVRQLERAVELRPQDPVINDHLGDAYWRVGRYQEARFQWRRALSLAPEADLVPVIEGKIRHGLKDLGKDI